MNNYKECLEHDSMFHDARIKLALLNLTIKKDKGPALKHLDRVLGYDSMQKAALMFRALLSDEKDKIQPVRDLTRLLTVSPNDLLALYFRGLFSAELGNFYQAFNDFQKVIKATETSDNNFKGQQSGIDKKIDLQNVGVYTMMRVYGLPEDDGLNIKKAYCQILIREFDKAIATLESISVSREDPLVVYLKAVAYEHKGEHMKALNFYDQALKLDNDIADAHKKRGIYAQELKQWPLSIRDFSEVLRLTPDAFVIYKIRGTSYYHNNQFKSAINDYTRYLKYDSGNAEVLGSRGMAYRQSGDRLLSYADFAASENPQAIDFTDAVKLLDELLAKKDTLQALPILDIMTKTTPFFTEGFVRHFKIRVAQKNWKFIKDNIAVALRNSRVGAPKEDHSYLLTLQAMIYWQTQHPDDALDTFNSAIKFDRSNSLAFFERGKLLLEMGKRSKAEADLKTASSLGNSQAKTLLADLGH